MDFRGVRGLWISIPGWYSAEVQSSKIENEITVVYVSKPDCVYTVEVTPLLAQGKLRI